jgi:flagellar hook-associated protein 1 FlgK
MQSQLDEIARGLISAFRETDQPGGAVLPDAPGLFTWSGAPGMPAAGALVEGLAGSISINSAFVSSTGGDPGLLRDGGANGPGYVANSGGAASYSAQILIYVDRLDAPMQFDQSAGNGTGVSLANYAANSIGWFEGARKDATSAVETKEALAARTEEALSNATGVNVDTEMSLLLDLEHSYQASSRIIKAVDEMLATLLAAVG